MRMGVIPLAILIVTVLPTEAATIRGRAYDAITGAPVDAYVEVIVPYDKGPLRLDSPPPHRYVRGQAIYRPDRMSFRLDPSSSNGSFEFHGVAPGQKLVYVRPNRGYGFAYEYVNVKDVDAIQHVDFPLERAATVSGVVVDELGKPVPHATAVLLYTDPDILDFVLAGGAAREEVQADVAGAFAFEAVVKPSQPFRLEVYSPNYPSAFSDPLTVQPAQHRAGIVLRLAEHGFRVLISVLDADGRPLSGAPVTLHSQIQPPREVAQYLSPQFFRSGFTDSEGKLEFTGVAPGPWEVSASEPQAGGSSGRDRRSTSRRIELTGSPARRDTEVTLRLK